MTDDPTSHANRKLVRCQLVNPYQETSVRYIELDAFRLWEYLMSHKPGMRVGEPTLCLWIPAEEYRRNASVFDRAGGVEAVDRIVFELFDREYGFSQSISRFARSAETEQMVEILRSHVPSALRNSDACQVAVADGRAVQQWPRRANRNILIGLEG